MQQVSVTFDGPDEIHTTAPGPGPHGTTGRPVKTVVARGRRNKARGCPEIRHTGAIIRHTEAVIRHAGAGPPARRVGHAQKHIRKGRIQKSDP